MAVDDTPENLQLIEGMLSEKGYYVFGLPSGELALKAAAKNLPDLILLDILMPGMDGFEVCAKLKADPKLADIPVIFLSALSETADKVKGFQSGGVDYITKPFQIEEVHARVSLHLELQEQRKRVKELLSSTLVGAIKAFSELLAVGSPDAYSSTLQIVQMIKKMSQQLGVEETWEYEVAAMMVNLGSSITCGRGAARSSSKAKVAGEITHVDASDQIARKTAAKVIQCIPRLETVGKIIQQSSDCVSPTSNWKEWPTDILGAQLLKVATEFERRLLLGSEEDSIMRALQKAENVYHPVIVQSLLQVVLSERTRTGRDNQIIIECSSEFMPGMVLTENLTTLYGAVLLPKRTELTARLCELLRSPARSRVMSFPVTVVAANAEGDTNANQ